MTSTQKKFIVAGVILAVAVGYLAFAGVKKGWVYYVTVDQFAKDPEIQRQRVKLCGVVGQEGLIKNAAGLRAEFSLRGKSGSIPVVYRGVIPDLFGGGKDVVVEGKLDDRGVFQADMLMTKCASKYEGQEHPGSEHP